MREFGKLIFFDSHVFLCFFAPSLLAYPSLCFVLLSLSTLFLSHLSYLFLSSFHNFSHLFPSQSPSFPNFSIFFYFILPYSCPLSSFCSYSPSFPLSPFSPIFSLSFSFLYFSPYPSLLSYILFSPTLLMLLIFLPKWEFPIGWWTPHKQPLCNSCP